MLHRMETAQLKKDTGHGEMIRPELFRRLRRSRESLIGLGQMPGVLKLDRLIHILPPARGWDLGAVRQNRNPERPH